MADNSDTQHDVGAWRDELPRATTIDGAAEALAVSRGTVLRMISDGELRAVKLRSRVVIPIAELRRLLDVSEAA
ncbi:MAG: excisionase family DNA-binding protein [Myxococcales bacterium]|nr:excisionase family DNA-binding protein [Myxococcales bacterium]